jgi:hypothetical protein
MNSSEVIHSLLSLFNTDFIRKGLQVIAFGKEKLRIHVGPVDSWPLHLHRGETCAMVFNTQYHNEPGEHWLGVYVDGGSHQGFIYDSMPLNDFPAIILSKLSSVCDSIENDNKDGCGLYCLAFHDRRSMKLPPLKLNPCTPMLNDIEILNYMLPYIVLVL